MEELLFKFSLCVFVDVFLIIGDDGFGDSLSDGVDLASVTTTSALNSDVKIGESLGSEKEDGLIDLNSQGCGLKDIEWVSVDSDDTGTGLAGSDSKTVLLSAESLNVLSSGFGHNL